MQAISQSLSTVFAIRCSLPIRSRCASRSRNDSKKGSLDSIASFPVFVVPVVVPGVGQHPLPRPWGSAANFVLDGGAAPICFISVRMRQMRPNNGREGPNNADKIGSCVPCTEPENRPRQLISEFTRYVLHFMIFGMRFASWAERSRRPPLAPRFRCRGTHDVCGRKPLSRLLDLAAADQSP